MMLKYDFDELVDRKNTNSLKYDFAVKRGYPADVLPLWVADMDFRTAPCVTDRLKKEAEFGIFGYSDTQSKYFNIVSDWFSKHFGLQLEEQWLVKTPGIVFAIAMAIRAFTHEGDGVLIQQPVYYPYSDAIRNNGRKLINSPLQKIDGHYEIDFEDFETKIAENGVKLFLFCSPHNPVGRVWKLEELHRIAEICKRHRVLILEDQIFCDFTYKGYTQHMLFGLDEEIREQMILCTAPSKTFNITGLQTSNIFIANDKLRRQFIHAINQTGYSQLNQMGLAACEAAYADGEEWLNQLKEYLEGNLQFAREFLKKELPEITLIEPEGTFLIWLDFTKLHLSENERREMIVHYARLWLDSGAIFGKAGEGFERINIACPRATLKQAFAQLKDGITVYMAKKKQSGSDAV